MSKTHPGTNCVYISALETIHEMSKAHWIWYVHVAMEVMRMNKVQPTPKNIHKYKMRTLRYFTDPTIKDLYVDTKLRKEGNIFKRYIHLRGVKIGKD